MPPSTGKRRSPRFQKVDQPIAKIQKVSEEILAWTTDKFQNKYSKALCTPKPDIDKKTIKNVKPAESVQPVKSANAPKSVKPTSDVSSAGPHCSIEVTLVPKVAKTQQPVQKVTGDNASKKARPNGNLNKVMHVPNTLTQKSAKRDGSLADPGQEGKEVKPSETVETVSTISKAQNTVEKVESPQKATKNEPVAPKTSKPAKKIGLSDHDDHQIKKYKPVSSQTVNNIETVPMVPKTLQKANKVTSAASMTSISPAIGEQIGAGRDEISGIEASQINEQLSEGIKDSQVAEKELQALIEKLNKEIGEVNEEMAGDRRETTKLEALEKTAQQNLQKLFFEEDTTQRCVPQSVQCRYCTKPFMGDVVPKVLNCGHTFCRSCIEQRFNAIIICPKCNQMTFTPADRLATNLAISDHNEQVFLYL